MVQIKKGLLVLIIIASLLFGAFGVVAYMELDIASVISGNDGYIKLSQEEYDKFAEYCKTYEKAQLLKDFISENYYVPVEDETLNEGIYRGLFDSLGDQYSYYMTPKEYKDEVVSVSGDYSGIGITYSLDIYGNIVILGVYDDTPASEAGLQPLDYIIAVDGVPYGAENYNDISEIIRGKSGTDVTVTVLRGDETIDFTMTRRRIIVKTVDYEILDGNIGYISISGFEDSTVSDFKKALSYLENSNVDGFILDLRDNGGGIVDYSVEIADTLIDNGTVVYAEDQKGNREYYKAGPGRTELDYVVLVNQNSASAAEILAAGIQDNGEAPIVGTVTFGKGIIQVMNELSDGSAVKITMYQYFSANGSVIHKKGITPDFKIELKDTDYDENGLLVNDRQLKKAIEVLKYGK